MEGGRTQHLLPARPPVMRAGRAGSGPGSGCCDLLPLTLSSQKPPSPPRRSSRGRCQRVSGLPLWNGQET